MTPIDIQSAHSHAELNALLSRHPDGLAFKQGKWCHVLPSDNDGKNAVFTLCAEALTLHQLESVIKGLAGIVTFSGFVHHAFSGKFHDTVLVSNVSISQPELLNKKLAEIADTYRVEVAVQRQQPILCAGGLLVMDMDSTVIQIECIDEIAKLAGLGDKVAAVTAKAMRGELAFSESLISRVACLKGVEIRSLTQIRDSLPLMPGLMPLLATLQANNWKVAIASGGFTYFADYLKERLALDDARSNVLEVSDGKLTGKVLGEIVDASVKARTVKMLAEQWQIPHQQTVAMGDGANDLMMMSEAALGVACHAKPVVQAQADVAIRFGGLHHLLYLMQ